MSSNNIKFYHFSTNQSKLNTEVEDSSISFCSETRVISTHGIDYGLFEWDEIPNNEIQSWINNHTVAHYDMSKLTDSYAFSCYGLKPSSKNTVIETTNGSVKIISIPNNTSDEGLFINGMPSESAMSTRNVTVIPSCQCKVSGMSQFTDRFPEGYLSMGAEGINVTEDGIYTVPECDAFSSMISVHNVYGDSEDEGIDKIINISVEYIPIGKSISTPVIPGTFNEYGSYFPDINGNDTYLFLDGMSMSYLHPERAMFLINSYDLDESATLSGNSIHFTKSGYDLALIDYSLSSIRMKVTGLPNGARVLVKGVDNEDHYLGNGVSDIRFNSINPKSRIQEVEYKFSISILDDGTEGIDATVELLFSYEGSYLFSYGGLGGWVMNSNITNDYLSITNIAGFDNLRYESIEIPIFVTKDKDTKSIELDSYSVSKNRFEDKSTVTLSCGSTISESYTLNDIDITNRNSYIVSRKGGVISFKVGDNEFSLTENESISESYVTPYLMNGGITIFYNSIIFDQIPEKDTDGFTKQDLIDYVLEYILK